MKCKLTICLILALFIISVCLKTSSAEMFKNKNRTIKCDISYSDDDINHLDINMILYYLI